MMKLLHVLPLAAVGLAFVVPAEQILGELAIDDHHQDTTVENWFDEAVSSKDKLLSSFEKQLDQLTTTSKHAWDELSRVADKSVDSIYACTEDAAETLDGRFQEALEDADAWFEEQGIYQAFDDDEHRGANPFPGQLPQKRPHKNPHHKPNQTVYQLIAGSKYTTRLAKWISEYDDLVDILNSTDVNVTVFAPTDKAFEKIPEKAPKPSKDLLKKILAYHVVPGVYSAARVLTSHTIPTSLKGEHLSSDPVPQRLSIKLGLRGLTVNYRSRIIAINSFGTNGVVHGIDSIILPPPNAITIVDLFPGAFSTLELGLTKTGLLDTLNTTDHAGGTLFAPNNWAFQKLGPKINAFLFSNYGLKYLKALLEYHVVPDITLYSDAIYRAKSSDAEALEDLPRKGHFHVQLPTLLENRDLAVDVARLGGFIRIKINAFSTVAVADTIAQDGVIHVLRNVLIPPKRLANANVEDYNGQELSVEDLMERLEPYVAKQDL